MRVLKITRSQAEDLFDNDDTDEELVGDLAENVLWEMAPWTKSVKQVATSACETLYDVDGEKVRLWIIMGGEPCLAFEDYFDAQKFPVVEKYSDENWIKLQGRYRHQDKSNMLGPTAQELLPEGLKTIHDFVQKNIGKKRTRDSRYERFPIKNPIRSKTKASSGGFVEMQFDPRPSGIVISTPTDTVPRSSWWVRLDSIKRSIAGGQSSFATIAWENLTDDQYRMLSDMASSYEPPQRRRQ